MRLIKKSKNIKNSQSKQSRKKNSRTQQNYYLYVTIAIKALFFIALILIVYFKGANFFDYCVEKMYKSSGSLGLKLEEIIVQGREKTNQSALLDSINLKYGQNILEIDIDRAKFEIEKLDWVKSATIFRSLPHTLYIRIQERYPIAIWKNKNQFFIVDSDGMVIPTNDYHVYGKLPIIIGDQAYIKAPIIIKEVINYPLTQEKVKAFCRIRERRWNLIIDDNILVKLSDANMKEELFLLEKIISEEKLAPNIKEIDLRSQGRIFFLVNPEAINKVKNSRKGKKT